MIKKASERVTKSRTNQGASLRAGERAGLVTKSRTHKDSGVGTEGFRVYDEEKRRGHE